MEGKGWPESLVKKGVEEALAKFHRLEKERELAEYLSNLRPPQASLPHVSIKKKKKSRHDKMLDQWRNQWELENK
jgi:hypothetical protein